MDQRPNLSRVGLRIEIEKRLRQLAEVAAFLAHRGLPGRTFNASTTGRDPKGDRYGSFEGVKGVDLNEHTTTGRMKWLTGHVRKATVATLDFVRAELK